VSIKRKTIKKKISKKKSNSKLYIKKKAVKKKSSTKKKSTPKIKKKNISSEFVITKHTKIEGKVTNLGNISIEGELIGELDCNKITIETKGKCSGIFKSNDLIINGTIDGDIFVKNELIIKKTGIVMGNINYNTQIYIEPGAKVYGQLIPKKKPLLLPYLKKSEDMSSTLDYEQNKFYVDNKSIDDIDQNPNYQKSISTKPSTNKDRPFDKVIKSIFRK